MKRMLGAFLAVSLSSLSTLAQPLVDFTWGNLVNSATGWDVFAANQLGYFKDEGLNLKAVRLDQPTTAVQMILTRAIDVASNNTEVAISAAEKGAKLKILGATSARTPFSLLVRPEIETYADLRGKTIGIGQLNEASASMLKLLMDKNGVESSAYQLLALGGTPNRYAALSKGVVAATLLSQPQDFKAEQEGMKKLGSVMDVFDGPLTVYIAETGWATANRDRVVKFLRATVKANRWLHDPANRASAVEILVKASGASPSDADKTWELFYGGGGVMPKDLKLTDSSLQSFLTLRESKLTPAELVDASYLDAAMPK